MKKAIILYSTSFLIFFNLQINAQVCGLGTDNLPGCFMCIGTVTGNTVGYTYDFEPWSGPGCGWEKSQWFQFCNKEAEFNLYLTGFNFVNVTPPGPGMEWVLLDEGLNVITAGCGNGFNLHFHSSGMIPGQLYYFGVSNYLGNDFDFALTIDEVVGILDPTPRVVSANPDISNYCEGQIVEFSVAGMDCVTNYNWVLPAGTTILSGANTPIITVKLGSIGGVVCVTASNPCGSTPPFCKQITIDPIPPIIVPPVEVCQNNFPYTLNGEIFNGPGVFTRSYLNSRGCDSTTIYTINQKFIPLTTVPVEYFCLDDFPLFFQGNQFTAPGPHTLTLLTNEGCDSVVNYLLLTYPNTKLPLDTTICDGECLEFDGQQYCTTGQFQAIDPGKAPNGCDLYLDLDLEVLKPISVIDTPLILACDSNSTVTLSSIGSSTGQGVSYQWTTQNGTIVGSNSSQNITVSAPGTYTLDVTIQKNGVMCSSSSSILVTSSGAPPEQPQFETPVNDICSGNTQSYILDANPNATSYSWSVNPASPFTTAGDTIEVNWTQSGPAEICVVASNACGDSDTTCLNVNVLASPDAEFTVTDTLCQTDSSLVIFTGTADTSATINWTLNNASGTPADSFYLSWPTGGLKALALNISQNGCSDTYAQNIWVQAPLATPMLNCTPGLNEITFSWDTIPGADGYTVFVDSVSQGSTQNINFTISGLSGMDTIHFEVFANDTSICLPTSAS
ncbi:MAG: PKD domain-containing protein [Saprospiraceae bacterium]